MVTQPHHDPAEPVPHPGHHHLPRRLPGDSVQIGIRRMHLLASGQRRGHRQAGAEVHPDSELPVDRDVEAERPAVPDSCWIIRSANGELRHHLRVTPDRAPGFQSEGLVHRQMVHEGARRLQRREPASTRAGRIDHDVGAVLVVRTQVGVLVAHEHQHHHRPVAGEPAHLQAAVVDHGLRGVGIHDEHRGVLMRGAYPHRHGEHRSGDRVCGRVRGFGHTVNLERVLDTLQEVSRPARPDRGSVRTSVPPPPSW